MQPGCIVFQCLNNHSCALLLGMNSDFKQSHICILGCGRSGTSIFGELFESISAFEYVSEPYLQEIKQLKLPEGKFLAVKVPRPENEIVSHNGLPFDWEEFKEIFPKPATFFWQMRFPLDTIASLKVGISRNWGHHPRPFDWQDWLDKPLLWQCAYHWNFINTKGLASTNGEVIFSPYEELVLNPNQTAINLIKQAGWDPDDLMLEEIERWALRVNNTPNAHYVEAQTSSPYTTNDHKVKVGRWRENLSMDEIREILPMIEEGMKMTGYTLPVDLLGAI